MKRSPKEVRDALFSRIRDVVKMPASSSAIRGGILHASESWTWKRCFACCWEWKTNHCPVNC